MAFVSPKKDDATPASILELYAGLVRRPGASQGLWTQQSDILREYESRYSTTRELAVELPTGTGKTLPGLLLAEWNRRTKKRPIIYACPTRQLAEKVSRVAAIEGISTSLLVGKRSEWNAVAAQEYFSAKSVGVTTYSSVFNSDPKIDSPATIVFDDAHTGEQYVAGAYSLSVKGYDNRTAVNYDLLLDALKPSLDGMYYELCKNWRTDHGNNQVRLVLPAQNASTKTNVTAAVAKIAQEGDTFSRYNAKMIMAGLGSCLIYVSPGEVLIRPYVPPTHTSNTFSEADQRIYLSATLGYSGELERAFGVPKVTRLEMPKGAVAPQPARRFFVFPTLVGELGALSLTKAVLDMTKKAVVIAPDGKTAQKIADSFSEYPKFLDEKANLTNEILDNFANSNTGILPLAGRYDGIDLPGEQCRMVILARRPGQGSLHERYLLERARVSGPLNERIRTRFTQATGRCTRGPGDRAVVVIYDDDLVTYIAREQPGGRFDASLSAELSFGLENAKAGDVKNTADNVADFLGQTDEWLDSAEPILKEIIASNIAKGADRSTRDLREAVNHEVRAARFAWDGTWDMASSETLKAIAKLESVEGSNTFQAYLYILNWNWKTASLEKVPDPSAVEAAKDSLRKARDKSNNAAWTRETIRSGEVRHLSDADEIGVAAILEKLRSNDKTSNMSVLAKVVEQLARKEYEEFETGLTLLGQMFGAESFKPDGDGRTDSAWFWGDAQWIVIDAKSEHKESGLIAQSEIRQVNTQLRDIAGDRGVPVPDKSISVIASPKVAVHPSAEWSPERHVHLVSLADIRSLARRAQGTWEEIASLPAIQGATLREAVVSKLADALLLPSDVFEYLSRNPLAPDVVDG
ncbi:DEAD/DEAH box helicase [Nocardia salmonicida]|uniref:DEAD/DEAH box helicase n=1 Tax=Nocardia salmonicida TaxID=53431 RepID=UPI003CE6C2F0